MKSFWANDDWIREGVPTGINAARLLSKSILKTLVFNLKINSGNPIILLIKFKRQKVFIFIL